MLIHNGVPLEFFGDSLTRPDLVRFHATLGDPAFNTTWEALAVLVAIRLWRNKRHLSASLLLKSDSLGTLSAMRKQSARSPGLSLILAELALEEAELANGFTDLEHIPGVSNVWPDALSRLSAPEPNTIPPELRGATRRTPPPRPSRFYLSAREPRCDRPAGTPPRGT